MTRVEKNGNLKVAIICGILLSAAVALSVSVVTTPEMRTATREGGQPMHITENHVSAVPELPENEPETAVIQKIPETPYILPKEVPAKVPDSYNGIYEGDTITGTLTYYDVCVDCCGKEDGITASGIQIQNGVEPETTVVGCNWLPLMTIITINGERCIVADRGGKSLNTVGRIDVFNPAGHEDSRIKGITYNAEIVIVDLPDM